MIYHGAADPHQMNTLSDLGTAVKNTVSDLRPLKAEFDSIVVTGVSGMVVGAPVALALKKPLVVVRKNNDGSHAASNGDGLVLGVADLGERPLFLDDFVSSGRTLKTVSAQIPVTVAAQYLYRDRTYVKGDEARDTMMFNQPVNPTHSPSRSRSGPGRIARR